METERLSWDIKWPRSNYYCTLGRIKGDNFPSVYGVPEHKSPPRDSREKTAHHPEMLDFEPSGGSRWMLVLAPL